MSIAGTVVIVNDPNTLRANKIVKAVQDLEKQKAYFHVGYSTLTSHFLPSDCQDPLSYLPALYCAISATARRGADVLADLCLTSAKQYQELQPFLEGMHVIWISSEQAASWEPTHLNIDTDLSIEHAAKKIIDYLSEQYRYAESYPRWMPEKIPVPEAKTLGKIILLIGSSSSGKSTLATNIQNMAPETFIKVGIDTALVEYVHPRYMSEVPGHDPDAWSNTQSYSDDYHKQGSSWISPDDNTLNPYPYLRYRIGSVARLAFSTMYATMAAMARQGFNVVSDHCFHFQNTYAEALESLQGLPITYVCLNPSLEILKQRERQRGDRMLGIAESVYYQMVNDYVADLELDTGILSSEQCANTILQHLGYTSIKQGSK